MQLSNLKIAFVSLQKDAERVPPTSLIYLATYLREKINLPKENIKIIDKNYHDVKKEIENFNPSILAITAMTVLYQEAINLASEIKKSTNIPILIGGVHTSSLPESLKKCFDVGLIGEGEETLKELIDLYLKKERFDNEDLKKIKSIVYHENNQIKRTPLRNPLNLDSLPIPDFTFAHEGYFIKKEIAGISGVGVKCFLLSSRGCPYRCVFCSTSRFWGKMRFHSPEFIAKTVEKAIEDHNADYIQVHDDLFAINTERLISIRREFEKRGILEKIKGIEVAGRANLITDELCEEMKSLKVRVVNFGFESGSERVLDYLKGGSVTVEMNKNAIKSCRKYGFNVYGSLMYGSPSETIEDMKKTNEFIDFCLEEGVSYVWSFVSTPFPATPFWDIALERNKVSPNMNFSLLGHHNIKKPLLLDPEIPTELFARVFLKGRRKLRLFKLNLLKKFILKHPTRTVIMIIKEPKYYLGRVFRQLINQ
ncbi:MAG: radical SAM protein [Candidatus Woesearchaeota archaeon]